MQKQKHVLPKLKTSGKQRKPTRCCTLWHKQHFPVSYSTILRSSRILRETKIKYSLIFDPYYYEIMLNKINVKENANSGVYSWHITFRLCKLIQCCCCVKIRKDVSLHFAYLCLLLQFHHNLTKHVSQSCKSSHPIAIQLFKDT